MKSVIISILLSLFIYNPLNLKGEKKEGLFLDAYYGYSFINPGDLNANANYLREYYHYYNSLYRDTYNNAYSMATPLEVDGTIKDLKHKNIFGGRLKYYFSSESKLSRWAISLGFKYFSSFSRSSSELEYDIDNFYYGAYQLKRKTDLFRLYIEGYVPNISVHYSILNSRVFSLEAFISGGVIFGACGSFDQYNYQKTEDTGNIRNTEIIKINDGNGTGFAGEAGLKLEVNISKSLGIFLEGGYILQKINKISGDAIYIRNNKDSNSDGYTTHFNWSGDWVIEENTFGNRHDIYHGGLDQNSISDFSLDLSGFHLKIGISLKIF